MLATAKASPAAISESPISGMSSMNGRQRKAEAPGQCPSIQCTTAAGGYCARGSAEQTSGSRISTGRLASAMAGRRRQ